MTKWTITRLADVIELRRGFDLPTRQRNPGPFPVLSAGVTAGWHDEGPIKGPGFVVGRATNLGVPTWCERDFWPLNTTLYAADFKGNDPRFLYHLFEYTDLAGFDSGSVQPMLNRNYIAGVEVRVPDLGTQQAIAEVLGALDDKIAANDSVINTADELAKWTWIPALSDATDTVPLSSLARFVNGRAFTKGASGTGRVVIRIAELNSGIGGSTVYNDIEVDEDHLARPGDLLFAWSGSLTVARWFRDEAIINQHIFKVIPNEQPMWFVNQAVRAKLREFQAIAADKATTMGHIQRRHLDEPVIVPNAEQIKNLETLMSGLWNRALAAEQEKIRLESTRDSLLPLLMSGKVRVRDAEKVVEEVV